MKAMKSLQKSCSVVSTLGLLSMALACTSEAQTANSPNSKAQAKSGNSHRESAQSERPRHTPPPQAFEKCKGKKEGDTVQIITPRGDKISGRCSVSDKGLFAKPERPPHPPTEAEEGAGKRK